MPIPADALVEFDKVVSDQTAYGLSYFDAPSVDEDGDIVATLWYPVDCPVDIVWSEGVWTLCD